MRRTSVALLLVPLLLSGPQAGADTKAELKGLRDKLEKLQRDYLSTRESHAEAVDSLKQSERAISDAQRKVRQLESDQRETRAELGTIHDELAQVEHDLKQRQARLGLMLKETYMRGGGDSLKLILSGKDPNQISRDMAYLNYLSQEQVELIKSFQEERERLKLLKDSAARKELALTGIRQRKLAEQQTLLKERKARQTILAELSSKIRAQRREISTLQRDEKRLTALVEKLARLAKQQTRRAAKNTAPKSRPPKSGEPVAVVTEIPDAVFGDKPFAKLKGLLRLPVRGELMNRFGDPREGGQLSWKGLFIRATEGTEVRAVAGGQVVFAEWLRGFGNLVIVDHGGAYMSLYSNNESLYKQPGERVKAGDILASAGNSGGQEESGVYFELRHQGRPINPMAWIK